MKTYQDLLDYAQNLNYENQDLGYYANYIRSALDLDNILPDIDLEEENIPHIKIKYIVDTSLGHYECSYTTLLIYFKGEVLGLYTSAGKHKDYESLKIFNSNVYSQAKDYVLQALIFKYKSTLLKDDNNYNVTSLNDYIQREGETYPWEFLNEEYQPDNLIAFTIKQRWVKRDTEEVIPYNKDEELFTFTYSDYTKEKAEEQFKNSEFNPENGGPIIIEIISTQIEEVSKDCYVKA